MVHTPAVRACRHWSPQGGLDQTHLARWAQQLTLSTEKIVKNNKTNIINKHPPVYTTLACTLRQAGAVPVLGGGGGGQGTRHSRGTSHVLAQAYFTWMWLRILPTPLTCADTAGPTGTWRPTEDGAASEASTNHTCDGGLGAATRAAGPSVTSPT
uniref:Uncharacterized protein n=1 Tax=Rangifer tarandus platyrhynchus TaxID=3082113 RepID=A0ACB0FHR4_RANTA|nr:unnamed protein product [Rangifer tarandus platyrhynchus]